MTAPASPARELSGAGLLAARAAWALLFAVTLITVALSVPLGYATYHVPCAGGACFVDQLTAEGVAALAALGLTPRSYAVAALGGGLAQIFFPSMLVPGTLSDLTYDLIGFTAPLRRRVQSFIDRRFYRRKYDAAQALASLGASVRDDPDLTDLTERLVHVVDETMQPAHISLWLQEG